MVDAHQSGRTEDSHSSGPHFHYLSTLPRRDLLDKANIPRCFGGGLSSYYISVASKKALGIVAGTALSVLAAFLIVRFVANSVISIRGAVLANDPLSARQLPIADVEVAVEDTSQPQSVRSDASGFFDIPVTFERRMRPGEPVTLHFRHPNYQPLDLHNVAWDKLCIARMNPLTQTAAPSADIKITSVVARYSIRTTAVVNVGSAVKTFQVVNTGNVPCKGRRPCSPDGKWKAALGSAIMDAGPGNEFRNVRVSCIAGPCPFTRIDGPALNRSGESTRTLRVAALNWSDTATFLLEAEVYKTVASDVRRQSYPVMFGRALSFTLPAAADGVSIEADLNGTMIVFPIGPTLFLSWADCHLLVNKDQTKVYRCELKPGYRFSQPL
jgi:hypothetical protein